MPLTRLKTPKAVPRNAAGAERATIAESNPWVSAMCNPQSATPAATRPMFTASASTTSAAMSAAMPAMRRVRALIRSASRPDGYAAAE